MDSDIVSLRMSILNELREKYVTVIITCDDLSGTIFTIFNKAFVRMADDRVEIGNIEFARFDPNPSEIQRTDYPKLYSMEFIDPKFNSKYVIEKVGEILNEQS